MVITSDFRGRPPARIVDSSASRLTVAIVHCSLPKGAPRLILLVNASCSWPDSRGSPSSAAGAAAMLPIRSLSHRQASCKVCPGVVLSFKKDRLPGIPPVHRVVNPASFIRTRCSNHYRPPVVACNSLYLTKQHYSHNNKPTISHNSVLDTFVDPSGVASQLIQVVHI